MEFEFGVRFKIAAEGTDATELVERLGAAGCDDAVIGTGQPGRIALEFSREARSVEDAMISALRDVKKAIPNAELIEMTPDFVGLTEVAEFVGVSRQNMRKLMLAHATTFPAPVHEGSASVWHLAHVLKWLADRGDYAIRAPIVRSGQGRNGNQLDQGSSTFGWTSAKGSASTRCLGYDSIRARGDGAPAGHLTLAVDRWFYRYFGKADLSDTPNGTPPPTFVRRRPDVRLTRPDGYHNRPL